MEESASTSLKDRFLGCLLGVAIGDALGMPVEGWSAERIRDTFGWLDHYEAPLPNGHAGVLRAGEITGDTEMTLCLVEGLISANGFVDPEAVGIRLIKLLQSPTGRYLGRTSRMAIELMEETDEYQQGASGGWPAGNGAATRIAPLGLLHSVGHFNPEVFTREVIRAGLITHHDPESLNGALAIAYAIRLVAVGELPPDLLLAEVAAFIDEDQVARQVRLAARLVSSGGEREADLANLRKIGTSSYVAETVASALYCFACHPDDFATAVFTAINAGGDTDTIGSMVGALGGAHLGARRLPPELVDGLEARMYILAAGPGLYRMAQRRAGMFLRLTERE